jgi:lysozyme
MRHQAALILFSIAALLLIASCGGKTKAVYAKRPVAPRDTAAPYDGIDVSSHQGNINWDLVSADNNIRFVYIKATEGATYHSPHYSRNVKMARSHGILIGSYHYLTSTSSIQSQFQNFVSLASSDSQDLVPMIDIEHRGEWSRRQLIDSVAEFARLLQDYFGVQPMIYSTMTFYNANLAPYFNKYPLYIGRYSKHEPQVSWDGKYTVWQFSEKGIIPGIDAYVDLCHYHKGAWLDEIEIPKSTTSATS